MMINLVVFDILTESREYMCRFYSHVCYFCQSRRGKNLNLYFYNLFHCRTTQTEFFNPIKKKLSDLVIGDCIVRYTHDLWLIFVNLYPSQGQSA